MQDTEIYAKTDAGRDEIRARSLGLTMAARAILLMVDGQRTVGAMRTLIAGSKAPADVLDQLLAKGFIERRTASSPAAREPAHRPLAEAPAVAPAPAVERALPASLYDGPLDLVLPTILGHVDPPAVPPAAPVQATGADAPPRPAASAPDRYEHLYAMMNDIVRDFLAPHRRFFFQLKIERCKSADELLALLPDLRSVLAKSGGDAFAADVIARLRNAAG